MGDVVVSEFITLDGVFEDPGGSESSQRGGWAFRFDRGPEGDKFKVDETMAAGAMLLGRVTYEGFAEAWPGRTDEIGFADKMNNMPKYVVSGSLEHADWNNSTVVGDDVAGVVARLRSELDGALLVAGSGTLVRTLLEQDLVDELRLMVFPVVLGGGRRLFADGGPSAEFELADCRPAAQCAILVYRRSLADRGGSLAYDERCVTATSHARGRQPRAATRTAPNRADPVLLPDARLAIRGRGRGAGNDDPRMAEL